MKKYMINVFSIKKIADSIWRINEPFFAEGANMYLFAGSKQQLLVDAGVGAGNIYAFLAARGFKNVYTVITHAHFDHCGGLIHAKPDRVFITPEQADSIKDSRYWGLQYMHKKDFNIRDLKQINELSFEHFFDRSRKVKHAQYTVGIPENILSFGRFNLQILSAPGHTTDSIVLYDSHKGILVSGDTLYDGKIYLDFPDSDQHDFADVLKRLNKLDFQLVLPGHNRELGKGKARRVIRRWQKNLK